MSLWGYSTVGFYAVRGTVIHVPGRVAAPVTAITVVRDVSVWGISGPHERCVYLVRYPALLIFKRHALCRCNPEVSNHYRGCHHRVRSASGFVFWPFTRWNFSRCNNSIPAGFVLAWTSIHVLNLRANLAGMKHFHPDIFHLVNGSAWEI